MKYLIIIKIFIISSIFSIQMNNFWNETILNFSRQNLECE